VEFFRQGYKNFNSARLAFLLFLNHLFSEVKQRLVDEHELRLVEPEHWRDWLDQPSTSTNDSEESNRDKLYRDVLNQVYCHVCRYFSTVLM